SNFPARDQLRNVATPWVLSPHFDFLFTPPAEIYRLSLDDALPIFGRFGGGPVGSAPLAPGGGHAGAAERQVQAPEPAGGRHVDRSEEHTSELQSRENLVCRLLLEKKKKERMRRSQ